MSELSQLVEGMVQAVQLELRSATQATSKPGDLLAADHVRLMQRDDDGTARYRMRTTSWPPAWQQSSFELRRRAGRSPSEWLKARLISTTTLPNGAFEVT